jgi:hypothetical protein
MSAAFSGEGRATNTVWFCHFGYSASTGESVIHVFVTEEILLGVDPGCRNLFS